MKKIQRVDALFELLRVVLGLAIAYLIAIVFIILASGSGQSAMDAVYNFMLGPLMTQRRFGQLMGKIYPVCADGMWLLLYLQCRTVFTDR